MLAVTDMTMTVSPAARKLTFKKDLMWLSLVSCLVMPGREWWNMNENIRLEKTSEK